MVVHVATSLAVEERRSFPVINGEQFCVHLQRSGPVLNMVTVGNHNVKGVLNV